MADAPHATHPYIFLFIGFVLLVAALLKSIRVRVPLTIALFLLGIACGALGDICESFQAFIEPIHSMSPSFLFYIFFPVLIFEAAFNCEAAVFQLMWREIFCLALPGMLISTALTGGFIKLAMYPQWSVTACLLYGAIISATDPVATLAILRDLGINERTRAILDGESIFNDGAAMVLYAVLVPFIENPIGAGDVQLGWVSQTVQCARLVGGAVALGASMGCLLVRILANCTDKTAEITLIYALSVIAFFVAESWLEVSGVLTLCFMGLCFAFRRHVVHPHNAELLNAFWEILVYIANALIFTIVGVYVSNQRFSGMGWYDYLMIPVLYGALVTIRFAMVFVLLGICRSRPHARVRLELKELLVIASNGLRGAVALTLALVIRHDHRITNVTMKQQFLLLTAGQVCFTVILNGLLCKPIVQALGLQRPTKAKAMEIDWACAKIESENAAKRKHLEHSGMFPGVDWSNVAQIECLPHGLEVFQGGLAERGTDAIQSHHSVFHRLLHNTSVVLFEKGFLSTNAIHVIVFQTQQCSTEDRLVTLTDLVTKMCFTPRQESPREIPTRRWQSRLAHPIETIRSWMHARATNAQRDVLLGYRTVLETLRSAMMSTGAQGVAPVMLCRSQLYPNSFKKWISVHVTQELTAVQQALDLMGASEMSGSEQISSRHDSQDAQLCASSRPHNRLLAKIMLRSMTDTIEELVGGGLMNVVTAERFACFVRAQEVTQWK